MAPARPSMEDRRYQDLKWFPTARGPGDDAIDRHVEEARQAVRVGHEEEVARIRRSLESRQSVLATCDKELTRPVLQALKEEMGNAVRLPEVTFNKPDRAGGGAVARLVQALVDRLGADASTPESPHRFLVIPHLDLMTWSAADEPGPHLNDVVFWLSEYRDVTVLAFWGSGRPVPEAVKALFPVQVELGTAPRVALWKLAAPAEARMLSDDETHFTLAAQLRLYHYVSGLNVVRLRQVLRELAAQNLAQHVQTDKAFQFLHALACPAAPQPGADWGRVAGYKDVRDELERRVLFPMRLRHRAASPAQLVQADALIPRGVLLHGPPGTGKTEWAMYLARELRASFQMVRGPELKNMYVGETERAIRAVFARARREAPALILIDEIDALVARRDAHSSHHEVSVAGQVLTEMTRLPGDVAVLVVGTTNLVEALDNAFFRPGRFGVKILIDYPGETDRRTILDYHAGRLQLPLGPDAVEELVGLTGKSIDPDHAAEMKQYLAAYVKHCVNAAFHREAGPLAQERLRAELGLGREEYYSGDHLRAICEYLLNETRWCESWGEPVDCNDPALLRRAVESVGLRRRTAGPRPTPPPTGGDEAAF